MSRFPELFTRIAALVAAMVVVAAADHAIAVGIYDYQVTRSFSLPAPNELSGGQVLYDPLPDGRLLVLNGTTVSVETGLKTGTFNTLGTIAGYSPAFGPSFLAVSPDGTRAVAGTGVHSVTVFDTNNPSNPLTASNYPISDFSGAWIDNRYLAIANPVSSTSSRVQILDTTDLSGSSVSTVVDNIGGASAGVAFDSAGNLYTGNGFDPVPGGSSAGWVKAFLAEDLRNAHAPLDFEASGTPIVDLLSAYPIGFDGSGNLFVGGSDGFGSGDSGYAALVDAAAVANALAGSQSTPPITPGSPTDDLRKFISASEFDTPYWNYNAATGELYLSYAFSDGPVSVYVAVPEPSCILLIVVSGMLLLARRFPKA